MLAQSPYHQQQPSNAVNVQQPQGSQQPQDIQQQPMQMRLRQDPPTVNPPAPRSSRKRKTPPGGADQQQPMPPPQPQPGMQHSLPPPHTLVPPHMQPPHGFPPLQYGPTDYSTAGLPPSHTVHNLPPPQPEQPISPSEQQGQQSGGTAGRTLSQSKRAEQNRKAQRAFRERRDQHVKALESRSQLLDAALASADEANRRWEECRALVDQLRIENAALRAALSQAQVGSGNGGLDGQQHLHEKGPGQGDNSEEQKN
ncbi:hypothetical protein DENSPDRAFT_837830 [Dentipellis sp. KUC8613]|nr:hypothetical protein DENSPDRAFT_837830 [Dentipellis sp. KUC8613]